MSECGKKAQPGGCEGCTCCGHREPRAGRVPWLALGLLLLLGFALLFGLLFPKNAPKGPASLFNKTGLSAETEEAQTP